MSGKSGRRSFDEEFLHHPRLAAANPDGAVCVTNNSIFSNTGRVLKLEP